MKIEFPRAEKCVPSVSVLRDNPLFSLERMNSVLSNILNYPCTGRHSCPRFAVIKCVDQVHAKYYLGTHTAAKIFRVETGTMCSSWPPLHQYLSLPLPSSPVHKVSCESSRFSELQIFFTYLTYDSATNTYPTDRHLSTLGANDYVFLLLSWNRMGFDTARLQAMQRFACTCIICANTEEERAELQAAGIRCIFFNQNALLDERIISPRGTVHDPLSEFPWPPQQPKTPTGSIDQASAATANLLANTSQGSTTSNDPASRLLGCDCDGRRWDLVVNSSLAAYKRLHLAGAVVSCVHIGIPVTGLACVSPPSSVLLANRITRCKGGSDVSNHFSSGGYDSHLSSSGDHLGSGSVGSSHPSSSIAKIVQTSSTSGGIMLSSDGAQEAPPAETYRYLLPSEVCCVLNQARVGGIFSAEEGTCYACTEYLFAGLPVITTPSQGGRHVWLNGSNSITVEACCNITHCTCDGKDNTHAPKQAVAQAVASAVTALKTGVFDRAKIRGDAITTAWQFRKTLMTEIQAILNEHGLGEVMDVQEHFCRTFTHKLQGQSFCPKN